MALSQLTADGVNFANTAQPSALLAGKSLADKTWPPITECSDKPHS